MKVCVVGFYFRPVGGEHSQRGRGFNYHTSMQPDCFNIKIVLV